MDRSEALYGTHARDRPAALQACCLREMLRSLKPMPGSAKTAPVRGRLSKAREPVLVYLSTSSVKTSRALDPRPAGDYKIKPHKLANGISASWKFDFLLVLVPSS